MPERNRDRSQEVERAGTKGRQEERRMLDNYKKREYQGGQEWRAACLQARQGKASPARFLAYKIVQGVDQAHPEHENDAGQGTELAQGGSWRTHREVLRHSEQVNRQRKSYGQHVPDPSGAPTYHPRPKFVQPRSSLGDGHDNEDGNERRECPETSERQEIPRDDVGQDEERDERVALSTVIRSFLSPTREQDEFF
jgi:hypothetical protein